MNDKDMEPPGTYRSRILKPLEEKLQGAESLCLEQRQILLSLKEGIIAGDDGGGDSAQQLAAKKMKILLKAMESEKRAVKKTIAHLRKSYDLLFHNLESLPVRAGEDEKGSETLQTVEELNELKRFFSGLALLIILSEECYKTICATFNEFHESEEFCSEAVEAGGSQNQLGSDI